MIFSDDNECSNGEADCGDNAKCINTLGDYECVCCDGYEDDGNGNCAGSDSEHTTGEKCCVCGGRQCGREGEVCGEDGKTYDSVADLRIHECEDDKSIGIDYYGRCRHSCDEVNCFRYQTCDVNSDGVATCLCEGCTDDEESPEPVCSEEYEEYDSECVFKERMCEFDLEQKLLPKGIECNADNVPVGEWSSWSTCSVTCGKGEKSRTREVLRPRSEDEVLNIELERIADCYMEPCDGPCKDYECDNPSAECIVNDVNEAECECPSCKSEGKDRVCGLVGTEVGTYNSLCHLQKAACKQEVPFELVYTGECVDEPRQCIRVPVDIQPITDNGCTSNGSVVLYGCKGSCGDDVDDCCTPTYVVGMVQLTCPDDSTFGHEVVDVEACTCQVPSEEP
ncbi:hypothetical protein ScPMuIL_012141 [Solemya velum]